MSLPKFLAAAFISLVISSPALALTIIEEEPKADPTQLIKTVLIVVIGVIVFGGIFYWGNKKFGEKKD